MKTSTDPLESPKLRVTHKDRKKLSGHLSGHNKLVDIIATGMLSESDLRKLVIIEAEKPDPRKAIVEKLLGAYLSKLRRRAMQETVKSQTT